MEQIEADRIIKELRIMTKDPLCNTESIIKNYGEILTGITKQVPKSLRHEKYTDDPFSPDEEYWLCPRCDTDLTGETFEDTKYCPYCGQRIKV